MSRFDGDRFELGDEGVDRVLNVVKLELTKLREEGRGEEVGSGWRNRSLV